MSQRQPSLFEGLRLTLDDAIALSLDSLREYGQRYRHWAVAYSGGKDSTAAVTFVAWAIQTGRVPAPQSLTVLYADTRLELPPLYAAAMRLLSQLQTQGYQTRVVVAPPDERFLVYLLGRGVPPPSNRFRWCTEQIKVEPMLAALSELRAAYGEKFLMLTGVRQGESAARDQRIAVSCSVNGGECGQGWFQTATPEAVADTLAPLLHWRVCHVYDWLYFDPVGHGYDASGIAAVYGEDEVRTGCVGCPLASRDNALERVVKQPAWTQLAPLLELKPLWRELKLAKWRKRKLTPERRQDGTYARNIQRMGPLVMEARAYGLERVLDIQQRAGVELLTPAEATRIRELWGLDCWPRKWSSADAYAADLVPKLRLTRDGRIAEQALLLSDTPV